MKKLVIREVESVKATAAAMYGCDTWWCPVCPIDPDDGGIG